MNILTSSSLSKFRDCPRRYFYAYELQRVPVREPDPLKFGRLWHTCMELWWLDGLESVVSYLTGHAAGIDPLDASKVSALLMHYNPPKDEYEVLGVEEPFKVPIGNPNGGRTFYGYRLAGQVDLRLRHCKTDAIWIVDHKTTSREIIGFGVFWQALQLDGQMNNYCLATDAVGFGYDVVRKLQLRLTKADAAQAKLLDIAPTEAYQLRCALHMRDSLEEWYQWRMFPKMEYDTREAALDLWQNVRMFHECAKAGRWPRNCNACVGMYGTCPYLPVCTGNADIADDAEYRTKEEQHEEVTVSRAEGAR